MKIGKILSIAVVSLASLIVLGAVAIAITSFGFSRNREQQNFAPSEGQHAVSPVGDVVLVSQTSGNSSFLYRKDPSSGRNVRLTTAVNGIESEASFSHNGKLVVYSFAEAPDSKSSVWMVGIDGNNPHPSPERMRTHFTRSFLPMTRRCFTPYQALPEITLQSPGQPGMIGMYFQFLFKETR